MFTEGNQLWRRRKKHGRSAIYEDAETLWNACVEYFKWVEENPLWEYKVTQFQGTPVDMQVPKMRAMTLQALRLYIGINKDTWAKYKKKSDEFLEVMETAEAIVYDQKFTGAAADLFNAQIIARDLGLKDTAETDEEDVKPLTINYNVVDCRKDAKP